MRTAEEIYKTFTAYEPDRAYSLPFLWPEQADLCLLGLGTGICYRSDKWTGEIIDYIHPHITPIAVMGPRLPGYPEAPPPPPAPVGTRFALLGKEAFFCTRIDFIDARDGSDQWFDFTLFQILPWIAAHQDGHTLIVIYPDTIPIIVTGPGLKITDRGIEG
jgi:hypothetical protein